MPSDERREKLGGPQAWEGRDGEGGGGSMVEFVLWTGGTTSLSMCSKKIQKEPQ